MKQYTDRIVRGSIFALVIGLIGLGASALAGTFVSFNGKFHFDYPDSWTQIDYQTAEFYLTRGNPEQEVDFEAVFSEKETFTLFQGQYMILTVDTVGGLNVEQVDSVIANLSEEFKRPVKEVTSEAFLAASELDTIVFDRANSVVAIVSEVAGDESGPRANLLVMQFFEHGIANYYFYAPLREFGSSLPVYRSMVTSFSTGEMDNALHSDGDVKVADLDGDDKGIGTYTILFGGLILILIGVLVARLKTRARKQ